MDKVEHRPAAEELITVKKSSLLLPDSEMHYLAEYVPCAEGAPLCDFMNEAEVVVKAMEETGAKLENAHAHALFLMRGFYFLGVLRGGEAYRSMMRDLVEPDTQDPLKEMPFSLDEVCADDFVFDLNNLKVKDLQMLWTKLGLKGENK